MKKTYHLFNRLLLGFLAVALLGQSVPLQAVSFGGFTNYLSRFYGDVKATPEQLKAIWQIGFKKWKGELISKKLQNKAFRGLAKAIVAALITAVGAYLGYQKWVNPKQISVKVEAEKLKENEDTNDTPQKSPTLISLIEELDSSQKGSNARELIKKLINQKEGMYERDDLENTVLMLLAERGEIDLIKHYLDKSEKSADTLLNEKNQFGKSILTMAISSLSGNKLKYKPEEGYKWLNYLLEKGAHVRDDARMQPIDWFLRVYITPAYYKGSLGLLHTFLSKGARPSEKVLKSLIKVIEEAHPYIADRDVNMSEEEFKRLVEGLKRLTLDPYEPARTDFYRALGTKSSSSFLQQLPPDIRREIFPWVIERTIPPK